VANSNCASNEILIGDSRDSGRDSLGTGME
jgi:hypothetical protein